MKAKHILFALCGVLIFYSGYMVNNYFMDSGKAVIEIYRDSTLYSNWQRDQEPEKGSPLTGTKKILPKIKRIQNTDSIMNMNISGYSKILEVRKKDDDLNVLSHQDSVLSESVYKLNSDNFRISSVSGGLMLTETIEPFTFNGYSAGFFYGYDQHINKFKLAVEIEMNWKIYEKFNAGLNINSNFGIGVRGSYTFK